VTVEPPTPAPEPVAQPAAIEASPVEVAPEPVTPLASEAVVAIDGAEAQASQVATEVPVTTVAEPVSTVEPTESPVVDAVPESPAQLTTESQPAAQPVAEPMPEPIAEVAVSTEPTGPVPAVSAEQVLAAIESASSQGALGKALLAYCDGRFKRAFLLGESFGLARVGRAWGPGCDSAAALALQVDLEAPSILAAATEGQRPLVASAPTEPQDAAIFAALAEPSSNLVVAPLSVRGRAVAFFVVEQGSAPVAESVIDEMARVMEKASEAYGRLHLGREG